MILATSRPVDLLDPANMGRDQVAKALGDILQALTDHGQVTLEMGTLESGAILRAWTSFLPTTGAL